MIGDNHKIPTGKLQGETFGSASPKMLLAEWSNGIYDEHPDILDYMNRNQKALSDESEGIERHCKSYGKLQRYQR